MMMMGGYVVGGCQTNHHHLIFVVDLSDDQRISPLRLRSPGNVLVKTTSQTIQ